MIRRRLWYHQLKLKREKNKLEEKSNFEVLGWLQVRLCGYVDFKHSLKLLKTIKYKYLLFM